MVRMNITDQDEQALKQVKKVVERVIKKGQLPNSLPELKEMFEVWNLVYKKNEKVTNCPSCRPKKFAQLKQTYDLFELDKKWNRKPRKRIKKIKK